MVARAFERDSLFAVIAGPLVWTAHFLALYVFTAIACAQGFFHHEVLGLRIVLLVGGALTAAGDRADPGRDVHLLAPLAGQGHRGRARAAARRMIATMPASRRRFMAYAGALAVGHRPDRDGLGDPADLVLRVLPMSRVMRLLLRIVPCLVLATPVQAHAPAALRPRASGLELELRSPGAGAGAHACPALRARDRAAVVARRRRPGRAGLARRRLPGRPRRAAAARW